MTNVLFLLNSSQLIKELISISADYGDINVVGCTSDSNCATQYLAKKNIDIVVIDMNITFLDSHENFHQLLEGTSNSNIKWIALTASPSLVPVFKDGCDYMAYVNSTTSADDLFQILRLVSKDYFVCKMEKNTDASLVMPAQPDETLLPQLTQREMQILRLLAQGLRNRDIATTTGLSEGTVKNHTTSIFNRLGLKGRTQAALWARNHLTCTKGD